MILYEHTIVYKAINGTMFITVIYKNKEKE